MQFLISSRRDRPGDDPIFALNAEARARATEGEPVVNATIGALLDDEGKLAVMPSMAEVLRSLEPEAVAAYAPIPGRTDFRQAVIEDLLGPYGLSDSATGVATPGGTGALRMAIDNFVEPQQTILTSSHFWGPYRTLARESGREFRTFNMLTEQGAFDVEDLDRKLEAVVRAQGRALIILNTPCHNPTGYSLDESELEAVCAVIERHANKAPVTLLLDIAYGYYAPAALANAIGAFTRLAGKAMVLFAWSASKSFLQYGLRVGSLVALTPDGEERKRVTNALTFSCRGIWSNCNAGGMLAITRVLSEPALRAQAIAEREQFAQMLARRVDRWNELAGPAGVRYPRYHGGFFTTVFCEDSAAVGASLRKEGVFLVPLAGALRVAICAVNEVQIERIVGALKRALA